MKKAIAAVVMTCYLSTIGLAQPNIKLTPSFKSTNGSKEYKLMASRAFGGDMGRREVLQQELDRPFCQKYKWIIIGASAVLIAAGVGVWVWNNNQRDKKDNRANSIYVYDDCFCSCSCRRPCSCSCSCDYGGVGKGDEESDSEREEELKAAGEQRAAARRQFWGDEREDNGVGGGSSGGGEDQNTKPEEEAVAANGETADPEDTNPNPEGSGSDAGAGGSETNDPNANSEGTSFHGQNRWGQDIIKEGSKENKEFYKWVDTAPVDEVMKFYDEIPAEWKCSWAAIMLKYYGINRYGEYTPMPLRTSRLDTPFEGQNIWNKDVRKKCSKENLKFWEWVYLGDVNEIQSFWDAIPGENKISYWGTRVVPEIIQDKIKAAEARAK